MKKIISVSTGLIVVVLAGWLGSSFYSARTTGNYVTSLPDLYQQHQFIHIKTIEHKQSAFSSTGTFEVRLPNGFVPNETASGVTGLIVQYSISNLLLPASAGRIDWQIRGDQASGAQLAQWFGQGPVMSGQGVIQYNGQRRSSFALAEILKKADGMSLQMTPVKGDLVWDNQMLKMQLKTDQFNIRSQDNAIDWRGIALSVDLSDRMLGIGDYSLSINKGSNDGSSFEGMTINKKVSVSDARLNILINQTIQRYAFNQFKLKLALTDIDQSFSMTNLDLASLQQISDILRDTKDMTQLTAQERMTISNALRRLLDQGFSVALPKLSAKTEGGSVEGKLSVDFLKSTGAAQAVFSTAERVRASGQLVLNGKIIDKVQRSTALMLGLAVGTSTGIKTEFDFSSGTVKVNGKTFDVKEYLGFADNMINEAITP